MQAVGSVLRHWRNKSAARNTTNYAVGSNTQKKKAQVMTNRCAGDIWHGGVREKKLYLRRQLERITTKWAGKTVGPIKPAKTAQVGAQDQLQTMVPQFALTDGLRLRAWAGICKNAQLRDFSPAQLNPNEIEFWPVS